MRILGFGTYDRSTHPRIGILLDGLRIDSASVSEVNEPLGFATSQRVDMLARPWTALRLGRRLAEKWMKLARRARAAARQQGPFDAIVVGYLGQFDVVLARMLFPHSRIVLDQLVFASDTARDRGLDTGLKIHLLELLDRTAVACADIVVVDTPEQLDLLEPKRRAKGIAIPVGASQSWFAAGGARQVLDASDDDRPPTHQRPLKVIFFGLFTPLQGAPVIGQALALLADFNGVQVALIGHGQDLQRTKELGAANPGVKWIDWMAPDELALTVAGSDVCLGIFGTTPKAQRVVPNKVYQGAAAGCAIVTSDTVPQRRALADAALFVPPGDGSALAFALRQLANDRRLLRQLRQSSYAQAQAHFTAAHIIEPLWRVLKE